MFATLFSPASPRPKEHQNKSVVFSLIQCLVSSGCRWFPFFFFDCLWSALHPTERIRQRHLFLPLGFDIPAVFSSSRQHFAVYCGKTSCFLCRCITEAKTRVSLSLSGIFHADPLFEATTEASASPQMSWQWSFYDLKLRVPLRTRPLYFSVVHALCSRSTKVTTWRQT